MPKSVHQNRILLALLFVVTGLFPAIGTAQERTVPDTSRISRTNDQCGTAEVWSVERTSRKDDTSNGWARPDVQLGDIIAIEVEHLDALLHCSQLLGKAIILYLDRRPFPENRPFATSGRRLHFDFDIHHVAGSEPGPWERILGSPSFDQTAVAVSVGLLDHEALVGEGEILLFPLPKKAFWFWVGAFLGIAILFALLVRKTKLIRNRITDPEAEDDKGTYSLGRTQAAWWFFFVLASHLLIGSVTGDWTGSINATALTLLGIGGATAVLGAAIDGGKAQETTVDRATMLTEKKGKLESLDDVINELEHALTNSGEKRTEGQEPEHALAKLKAQKRRLESQIKKLRSDSEGFWIDIISDANGASFHRFQMVGWTVVLSMVFALEVYRKLEMPSFDATLLGLMGVSSGTYLGMKTSEPNTPTE